jgi:hypothetical protein
MFSGILRYMRHQPIAIVALFIALGGTSYAASTVKSSAATTNSTSVLACQAPGHVTGKGVLAIVNSFADCPAGYARYTWNIVGQTGSAGVQGSDGNDGAVGSNGAQGPKGDSGAAGTNGTNGAPGVTGPAGAAGPGASVPQVIGANGVDLGDAVGPVISGNITYLTSAGALYTINAGTGTLAAGEIFRVLWSGAGCTGLPYVEEGAWEQGPTVTAGETFQTGNLGSTAGPLFQWGGGLVTVSTQSVQSGTECDQLTDNNAPMYLATEIAPSGSINVVGPVSIGLG